MISGLDARFAVPNHGVIGASKAALESLVRNLAVEFGPRYITVNAIAPGPVATDSLQYAIEQLPAQDRYLLDAIPMHKMAQPEDVASVIEFLTGPGASYISGAVIPVDGGLSAGGGPWVPLHFTD